METIQFLQSFANPVLDTVFTFITMMGEETFLMAVFFLFFWCIDKKFGYRIVFAFLSNGILNTWIKEIFRLPRPIGQPGIRSLRVETATGFSFPSGHTQSTASLWTSLALRYKHWAVTAAGVVFIILVGTSRMYLGVHYPRDVVFGALFGIGWVFVSNLLFDMAEKGKKAVMLVYLIPALLLPLVFPNEDGAKIAGTLMGVVAGYFIETGFIRFETKGTLLQHVLKIVFGFGIAMLMRFGIKALLPHALVSDFIRYLLIGLWVTAGAPWCFTRFFGGAGKNTDAAAKQAK